MCLPVFALNPAPRTGSFLSRSAPRTDDLVAGEHPFQFTVLLPPEERQVTVLPLVTSTKYKWSRWAWKGFYESWCQRWKVREQWSHWPNSGSGRGGGPVRGLCFPLSTPSQVLQPRQQGSGTVGKWTPCWWPRNSPRGLWSPSITLQTRQPLPQHFQQSTSDYLFMTLQHSFSSNFMAFH